MARIPLLPWHRISGFLVWFCYLALFWILIAVWFSYEIQNYAWRTQAILYFFFYYVKIPQKYNKEKGYEVSNHDSLKPKASIPKYRKKKLMTVRDVLYHQLRRKKYASWAKYFNKPKYWFLPRGVAHCFWHQRHPYLPLLDFSLEKYSGFKPSLRMDEIA